jgi:SAM-dependent methyltransferase
MMFFRKTGIDPDFYRHVKCSPKGDSVRRAQPGYRPDGSFLEGKCVLDLGCGMGRFADVAREYAREVVGLDFSGAVDTARCRYGHYDNLHFVQGDILSPPFAEGRFDFVYSLGVLHHTRRTSLAFQQAAALCAQGGHLAIWVYPPAFWNDVIRGTVARTLRLVTKRFSPRQLHAFCLALYPLGRLQMFMAGKRWTKILGSPLFLVPVPRDQDGRSVDLGVIYDYYSPQYIWTHTAEEVFDWYLESGFEEVRILPVATAVLGRKGPRPLPRGTVLPGSAAADSAATNRIGKADVASPVSGCEAIEEGRRG